MSHVDEEDLPLPRDKLDVVLSMLQYISKDAQYIPDPEVKESLVVAMQCLEMAYNVEYSKFKYTYPNIVDLGSIFVMGNAKILHFDPDNHKFYGNQCMSQGLYKQARDAYSKAIEIDPKNPIYFSNRAAALCSLYRYEEAVGDCQIAVTLDPAYSKAYGRLGFAYLHTNNPAGAVDAYVNALRYDPGNELYKEQLQIAWDHLREYADANPSFAPRTPTANATPATSFIQSTIRQMINNPSILNMASEIINNESIRQTMSGLIDMRHHNQGNHSMENLVMMGQQLADQVRIEHPEFLESLCTQFGMPPPFSNNPPASDSDTPKPSEKKDNSDSQGNA